MILRTAIILAVYLQLGSTATTQSRQRHELSISECATKMGECDEKKGRPVCGTDDRTYPTRCHLLRVQCSGHQVSLKYRGPCKACKEAREYALRHKSRNPPNFVPNCKEDGTYAAVQCLANTGCWCSDITGKPIKNTSLRMGKPKCHDYIRGNRRRSPPRMLNRRSCTPDDRAAFNGNLLTVFQSECMRATQQQQPPQLAAEAVLDWKFNQLDVNRNQMLDKNEFRELKKLVKRAVKPRRCGRAFGKFCDVNADDRLSHTEWNSCLSKDGNNRHASVDYNAASAATNQRSIDSTSTTTTTTTTTTTNNNQISNSHTNLNNHHHIISHKNNNLNVHKHNNRQDELDSGNEETEESSQQQNEYDDDYDNEDSADDDDDSAISLSMLNPRSSTNYPSIYFLNAKPESSTKESEGESDCWTDQAAALEEQNHGSMRLYVPECTPDGRYQRVQCYRSTPYCWCVNEDTGKNIPGTWVKDQRPQCDAIVPAVRPMKGCAEPRKTVFLKELKEFLKTQIPSTTNTGLNTTQWNSEDERIGTLSFVYLDKNKNKSWERKEWKVFREMVTSSKNLRKCGKKMPRYCDVNTDKKITLSEWLNCLQTQQAIEADAATPRPAQTNETATTKISKRVGSNPLEQYLKD